jgi:uncharacterized membrane protein YdbT with pleckstrin-like domain
MGYIDKNLMAGEHVVYRTSLHWIIFKWPIIFILIAIACFFGKNALPVGIGFSVGIAFLTAAVIASISPFITYKTSEFGVTNKRVMIKVGFIKRDSLETLLNKIEGIHVNQGILERILNYGTIAVVGTGGTSNAFHKINAPLQFRKKVQEQIVLG